MCGSVTLSSCSTKPTEVRDFRAPTHGRTMRTTRTLGLSLAVATLGMGVSASADTFTLKPVASGLLKKTEWKQFQSLKLSETPPDGLTKLPAHLAHPFYGVLTLGAREHPGSFIVIVDEPDGKPEKLFVDANGNGDLTDDPPTEWTTSPYRNPNGSDFTQFTGGAMFQVPYGASIRPLHLCFQRWDKEDPIHEFGRDLLMYYTDYGTEGRVTLGKRSYAVMLADTLASGDFRGAQGSGSSKVLLMIDVNGDGKFDTRGEIYDTRMPFTLQGVTYEVTQISADGDSLSIGKSRRSVPEVPAPPNLLPGHAILPFTAVATDGRAVKFPMDYRNRIVLLYFWATWCGSCAHDLPDVLKTYNAFHARGLEILGISLDHPNARVTLANYTRDRKMLWRQVYDGKGWEATVAKLYFVNHTPTALLVDGATGQILAAGQNLRSPRLLATVRATFVSRKISGR